MVPCEDHCFPCASVLTVSIVYSIHKQSYEIFSRFPLNVGLRKFDYENRFPSTHSNIDSSMATTIDWSHFSGFNKSLTRETLVDDSPILDPGQPGNQPGDSKSARVEREILKVPLPHYSCAILRIVVSVGSMDQQTARCRCYRETGNFWSLCRGCKFGHCCVLSQRVSHPPIDSAVLTSASKPPVRVRSEKDSNFQLVANPLFVHFGTWKPDLILELVDGPSALAYLFSIAMPDKPPTWQHYYLPMLVLLSKCLYLAYIGKKGDGEGNGKLKFRLTGVPFMSCVTYVETGNRDYYRYAFGSTFAVGPTSVAEGAVDRENRQMMMTDWRRELMNNMLKISHLLPKLPGLPLTILSPTYHRQLCGELFSRLIGNNPFLEAAKAAFDAVSVAQTLEMTQSNIAFQRISQHDVYGILKYRCEIQDSLKKAVKDRFDVSYKPHTMNLPAIFDDFVKLYLVPHLLEPSQPPGNNKLRLDAPIVEPSSPTYMTAKQAALTAFWLDASTPIQEVIDSVYTAVQYDEVRPTGSTWGRCAETYCFSGML